MALPAEINTSEVVQFCNDIAALSGRVAWSHKTVWNVDHYELTVANGGEDRKGVFSINIPRATNASEEASIEIWLSAIIGEVESIRSA